ncbi:unnamed protein product [Blepharisma stoltei]|uniref:Uncharacterized protein n=1 Tax=Blepharisma stoltei TaxID=1481888 RepID=A0AAU9K9Z0_9CILI|nr:unnamed protein product [Blepharisma stoltei]
MSSEQARLTPGAIDNKREDSKTPLENEMIHKPQHQKDFHKIKPVIPQGVMEGEPQKFTIIPHSEGGPAEGQIFVEEDPYITNVKTMKGSKD